MLKQVKKYLLVKEYVVLGAGSEALPDLIHVPGDIWYRSTMLNPLVAMVGSCNSSTLQWSDIEKVGPYTMVGLFKGRTLKRSDR